MENIERKNNKLIAILILFAIALIIVLSLVFGLRKPKKNDVESAIASAMVIANRDSREFSTTKSFGVNLKEELDCLVYKTKINETYVIYNDTIYSVSDSYKTKKKKKSFSFAKMFDSVSDMQSANLKVGDVVATRGYYNAFDGGEGLYEIIDEIDENIKGDIISLDNGLFANLKIYDMTVSILQYGYSQDCDDIVFENFFNSGFKFLYLPSGEYEFGTNITVKLNSQYIYGFSSSLNFNYEDEECEVNASNTSTACFEIKDSNDVRVVGLNFGATGLNEVLDDLVLVSNSNNVYMTGCNLNVEDFEIDCLEVKNGSNSFKIEECNINNFSSSSTAMTVKVGSGVEDFELYNCKVKSNCATELVFMEDVKSAKIQFNDFEGQETPEGEIGRISLFTIGNEQKTDLIKFDNNMVKGYSRNYFLNVGQVFALNIEKNSVEVDRCANSSGTYEFMHQSEFKDYTITTMSENDFVVGKDNIEINTLFDFKYGNIYRNKFTLNGKCTGWLINSSADILVNDFVVNGNVKYILHNVINFNHNNVTINGILSDSVYEFFNMQLSKSILIKDSNFYVEANGASLMKFSGGVYLNGFNVNFENIKFQCDRSGDKAVYICDKTSGILDDNPQNIYIKNCNLGTLAQINSDSGITHNFIIEN